MSFESPSKEIPSGFTLVDKVPAIKEGSDFENETFNEVVNNLRERNQKCATALLSLSPEQKSDMDKVFNRLGEGWEIFNLIDEGNDDRATEAIESFKNANDDSSKEKYVVEIVKIIG